VRGKQTRHSMRATGIKIDKNRFGLAQNYHRHHHKFIKYEKRLRKEGNMPRLTYQAQSLLLQRECGRVAHPSVPAVFAR
jgi:hypothetical protein